MTSKESPDMTTWPNLVGTAAPPRDPKLTTMKKRRTTAKWTMTASQQLSESQTKANRSILLRRNC
jgi:hypothetical protein